MKKSCQGGKISQISTQRHQDLGVFVPLWLGDFEGVEEITDFKAGGFGRV
jgi:hypothetical protein